MRPDQPAPVGAVDAVVQHAILAGWTPGSGRGRRQLHVRLLGEPRRRRRQHHHLLPRRM